MTIGSSDGNTYEDHFDRLLDRPSNDYTLGSNKSFTKTDETFTDATYDTKLTKSEEKDFQGWKAQHAPNDSGADYDLRGAFLRGVTSSPENGHFPDTFKKPNHPTFSDESMYYDPKKGLTPQQRINIGHEEIEDAINKGTLDPQGANMPVNAKLTQGIKQEQEQFIEEQQALRELGIKPQSDSGEFKIAGDVIPLPITPKPIEQKPSLTPSKYQQKQNEGENIIPFKPDKK